MSGNDLGIGAPQGPSLPQAPGILNPADKSGSTTIFGGEVLGSIKEKSVHLIVQAVSTSLMGAKNFIQQGIGGLYNYGKEFYNKYPQKTTVIQPNPPPTNTGQPASQATTTPSKFRFLDLKSFFNNFAFTYNSTNIYALVLTILGIIATGKGANDIYRNKNKKIAMAYVAGGVVQIVIAVFLTISSKKVVGTKP